VDLPGRSLAESVGFQSTGSIDAIQPILIFAIAFGLSMDYEVFLLSRIKERYDETGDNRAAVSSVFSGQEGSSQV